MGEHEAQQKGASRRELTLRAVVLGSVLSVVLGAANAYLGLFAGMTVSASIPAAVLSMGLLRAVGGTIYENNLVQTAASAGESAAAGAIFTLPALVLLGAWADFDFVLSGCLIALGGLFGVLFTILLRGSLLQTKELTFPEGVATYEVLRAGHGVTTEGEQTRGLRALVWGAALGGVFKFLESKMLWTRATLEGSASFLGKHFYLGIASSPALLSVGYIVGFEIASVVVLGGIINWVFVLPFVAEPAGGGDALSSLWAAWSQKTRYLGVGAMTVGGIFALWDVRHAVRFAVRAARSGLGGGTQGEKPLTERDLPPRWVLGSAALLALPTYVVFGVLTQAWGISVLLTLLVVVFGFLFSAVAAYMAGLVGSSNNPVSGVTLATILFTSLLLSLLGVKWSGVSSSAAGPAAAILVGSIVCTAAAIGGDNMQDLKAGSLLGATPYRQQILQIVGVLAASFVLAPVLSLLLHSYGFGAPTEAHPHPLRAPQATLMAAVAEGVFGGSLPWPFLVAGAGLGLGFTVLDKILAARGSRFKTPVLAVALGLYLPLEMTVPVFLGGALSFAVKRRAGESGSGLLMAAGLITGEALIGIFLAGLVAFSDSASLSGADTPLRSALGTVLVVVVCLGALALGASGKRRPL